jgi:hypothetical protein
MVKIKSILIYLIEFVLIFCCTTCTAFGMNSNDNKSVQSGDYLNSEVSNVNFDYYNYFFGLNSYGNTMITRYGKLPVMETNEQKERWNSTLEELSTKIKDTVVSKYMYPHGQVVTCGANAKGYFVILFQYGTVNESLINEIYTLISNSAEEMGVQDIPVEFGYGTYMKEFTLDSENGIYYEFGDSTKNLSKSDINIIQKIMKEKPITPVQKTVAAYGNIPLLKDQNEIINWANKLSSIANSTQDKMNPYVKKNQIIVYSAETTRLHVGINETLPSEEKTTIVKEIYHIIDEEARKQNMTDVPVYFDEGTFINQAEIKDLNSVENSSYGDSKFNNEDISMNSSNETGLNKKRSSPGVELFGSLICLYGGWRLRKK